MTRTKTVKAHGRSRIAGDGAHSLPALPYNDPLKGEMDLRDDERRIVSERSTLIRVDELRRHPQNRHPDQASIDDRAASLKADGQLQDVEVRRLPQGYQIISGETRWLAAKQIGWKELRCTVIECDDAEALRLVALHNGQRTDLNPIQRAELIESLCKSIEEGGAGQSREEAGRAVGVSPSAASNLVRLLRLPKVWRDRVASGELPESFARLLTPYLHVEPIAAAVEKAWKSTGWEHRAFDSRDDLERDVDNWVRQLTRRLDGAKRYYGGNEFGQRYDLCGEYPCLLDADEIEGNRKALAITTIPVTEKGKTIDVEVATNVKLFDKLQVEIIKRKADEKAKKKAAKAGKSVDSHDAKPKTAAELKQAKEQRTRQLQNAVDEWLETVLRRETAAAIGKLKPAAKIDPRLLRLVLFFTFDSCGGCDGFKLGEKLDELLSIEAPTNGPSSFSALNECLTRDPLQWQAIARELCAWLIGGDSEDPRPAEFDPDVLQALFTEWGGDLAAAWQRMYIDRDPLVEEFLQLHREEELEALGEEWGVHIVGKEKKIMLQMLLNRTSPLRLPKRLQPSAPRAKKGRAN